MKKLFAVVVLAVAMFVPGFANAAPANTVKFCTGSPTGNYHFAGKEISQRVGTSYTVELVETNGSLENLRKLMAGECDWGFAQSDVIDLFVMENPAAMNGFTNLATVYEEYVHVLCATANNFSRITHVGDARAKMFVGSEGSGVSETWRALRKADEKLYSKLERVPEQGISAARQVKDSTKENPSCMVWVSGLNSPDMQAANLMSVNTPSRKPSLMLVDVDDRDFKGIKNSRGQPMYEFKAIAKVEPQGNMPGVYNNLLQSRSVTVPVVKANLMATNKWYAQNKNNMTRVVLAIEDASPTIWKRVSPR